MKNNYSLERSNKQLTFGICEVNYFDTFIRIIKYERIKSSKVQINLFLSLTSETTSKENQKAVNLIQLEPVIQLLNVILSNKSSTRNAFNFYTELSPFRFCREKDHHDLIWNSVCRSDVMIRPCNEPKAAWELISSILWQDAGYKKDRKITVPFNRLYLPSLFQYDSLGANFKNVIIQHTG